MNLESFAKVLVVIGLVFVLGGVLFYLGAKLGITRLPGDIVWRGERTTVYIPLGLSILASIVLTILLNLFLRR